MSHISIFKAGAVVGKVDLPIDLKNGQALKDVDEDNMTDEQYQDHQKYIEFCILFASAVGNHNQFLSAWCFYTTDFTVPYEGAPTAVSYDGGWGTPQTVPLPPSPTILDVWKACDKAIQESGDHHHIFIEILENKDGVLHLETGS